MPDSIPEDSAFAVIHRKGIMARLFALNGNHPKLSVPNGDKLYQRFIVSSRGHFDTIDICLFTFSLPPAQERTLYGCSIRSWPCCNEGIPKEKVEEYLFTVLDHTVCRGRWIVLEWVRNLHSSSRLIRGSWSRGKPVDALFCKESAVSSLKRAVSEDPIIVTDAKETRPSKRASTWTSEEEEAVLNSLIDMARPACRPCSCARTSQAGGSLLNQHGPRSRRPRQAQRKNYRAAVPGDRETVLKNCTLDVFTS